jgi:hypothetical protein
LADPKLGEKKVHFGSQNSFLWANGGSWGQMEARNGFCGFFGGSWTLKTREKKNFDFWTDFRSDCRWKNNCLFGTFQTRESVFTRLQRADLGLSKNVRVAFLA